MPEMLTEQEQILQRMGELKQMLVANDPRMGLELTRIHKNLQESPELLHVLTDEQIATIVQTQSRVSQIAIVSTAAKKSPSKTSTGKRLKDVTLEDI